MAKYSFGSLMFRPAAPLIILKGFHGLGSQGEEGDHVEYGHQANADIP